MIPAAFLRALARRVGLVLLVTGLSAGAAVDAAAQCQVLGGPTAFDPPPSGLPSYLESQGNSIGLSASARRMVIRYNYGYVVFSLASPSAPVMTSVEDLLGQDGYPKSGDGQSRTARLALSSDGLRVLIPWTDTTGFGTIAQPYGGTSFGVGGDFPPPGNNAGQSTVARVGSRYLGFTATALGLFAADVTNLPSSGSSVKNSIASEAVSGLGTDLNGLKTVETSSRSWVVASSETRVVVLDVTGAGPSVPGMTSGMTWRSYARTELGMPTGAVITAVAAEAHPADEALHLLVEGAVVSGGVTSSSGVRLLRIDPSTGAAIPVASYTPPPGELPQSETVLLRFDSDLVAFVLHRLRAGGLKLDVRSSLDFGTNLASSITTFPTPAVLQAMKGFRSSGGNAHLYIGDGSKTFALSLNCATAPSPAKGTIAVDRIPSVGSPTTVPDGGSVFIGDQLKIKTSFTPPDAVSPLLDWRLDYDFHEGNTADSQTTAMRLINADASRTIGPALPPADFTLVGPCDPAEIPEGGSAPSPATGLGCWTSVTTNGDFGIPLGTPDFSDASPVDKQLTIAFEVQNALSAGDSDVARHRITWKVPQQELASSALLSGGGLTDASDGSPATTGFKWYFASVAVGTAGDDQLTLKADCGGPTCNPSLQEPGDYRYWVSVPYRGGFRTPDCPGLDGTTCTGLSTKTVKVTDVVLAMTAPTQVLVGTATFNVNSTSQRATGAGPCPAISTGFSYNFCEVLGGTCDEGPGGYVSTGVVAPNAFPGTITLPTPSVGTWGLRIRYSYATGGSCEPPTFAQWPAEGALSQLTVLQAVPSIHLRNSTDTADIPKSLGFYWELTAGQTVRAYVDLNSVRDMNPPAGLSWAYRLAGSVNETAISIVAGSPKYGSFAVATAGDYEIVLRGYGSDVVAPFGVSASGGGGGGGTGPPTVTSLSASPSAPSTGQSVFFTCNATQGGAPITSYDWVLDSGVTRSTSGGSTTYVYTSAGTKTYSCTANDSAGASSSTFVRQLTVSAGGTGSCTFEIKNSAGAKVSYDPVFKLYEAATGQPLTFEATGATGTIGWNFGNGATGSGNPANYTYPAAGSFKVTLTATGCSTTADISIAAGTTLDFSVADAGTGASVLRTGNTWEATAGQRLKFAATGATGAVSWNFGDGETSTLATPEKTYAPLVDTPYTVTLTNGAATKAYTVAVKGSTGAPLTGNYTFRYADGTAVNRSAVQPNKAITFTAADQATTYTWDFGDGSGIGQGSPREHTFTRGGTFAVKLSVARAGVPGTVSTAFPLAFVVTPPPDPLLWVAGGMAYVDGGGGERWQSDLSVFNPGAATATVSIGFVSGAGWAGASEVDWIVEAIPPGQTKAYANILSSLFRLDKGAWGVVLVRGDQIPASPVIVSRTYNAANAETAGTFGLSVPALSVAAGVRPQSAVGANFLAGLRHDSGFRTNFTVANLKDETAEVEVVFRGADGSVLGSPARIIVEGRGVKQVNSVLSAPPPTGEGQAGGAGWATPVSHFSAEVQLKKGTGVFPYATVIDMGTGDSIVVTPAPRPSPTYRLPGVVRNKGKGGATWVSDVAILNPNGRDRRVRISYSYVKGGTTRRVTLEDTLLFKPWEMKVGVDFVKQWLGLEEGDTSDYAASYVDISPAFDDAAPDEPLVVVGKTYTTSGNGTTGLQVDPYVFEDGIGVQASGKRILLSGLEAYTRFRTNVALFLTPGATATDGAEVDVHVLDSRGRELRSIWVQLNADKPVHQLGSDVLFAGDTTTDVERASIVISNPRGTGRVGAYATVIDNLSGDATFVAGQPAP